jgi:hypothetical protein
MIFRRNVTFIFWKACCFLSALCSPSILFSQQVELSAEKGVQDIKAYYQDYMNTKTEGTGWRIQFYSTTDRRNMESTIKRLRSNYPQIKFTWTYDNPFYRIRAGAFRYRQDAMPLLYEFKKEFPGAFPIEDKVDFRELIESY